MKKIICFFALVLSVLSMNAQDNKELIIKKIAEANEKYAYVTCPFEQVKAMRGVKKEMVSEGTLQFKRATSELHMQYTKPSNNQLLITGDKLVLIDSKARNTYSTKTNAAMKALKWTLIYSIGGDIAKAAEVNDAAINLLPSSDYYAFELIIEKNVKGGWAKLELSYSKKDYSLCLMKMIEKNGNSVTYKTPVKEFNK